MSTAEGEWSAQAMGAQAVSRCASPPTTTVVTTSAAHRGTHPLWYFQNTPEWNEWLVCVPYIHMRAVLPAVNFQLRSPIRTES